MPESPEVKLARRVLRVLRKASNGNTPTTFRPDPTKWAGFENGNGTEVGSEIDALIAACERIANKS